MVEKLYIYKNGSSVELTMNNKEELCLTRNRFAFYNAETYIKCQQLELEGVPPQLAECFQLLKKSGACHFALFGGAIRDADYAARNNKPLVIKDYDLRVWLPKENHETHLITFIEKLGIVSGEPIEMVPSLGSDRFRYGLNYKGIELDISVRPIPDKFQNASITSEDVAIDRAMDSDIGICSVAIDCLGRAWAKPEYLLDQKKKTLTVYPNPNLERKLAYTERMKQKFPDHEIVELESQNALSQEKLGM